MSVLHTHTCKCNVRRSITEII